MRVSHGLFFVCQKVFTASGTLESWCFFFQWCRKWIGDAGQNEWIEFLELPYMWASDVFERKYGDDRLKPPSDLDAFATLNSLFLSIPGERSPGSAAYVRVCTMHPYSCHRNTYVGRTKKCVEKDKTCKSRSKWTRFFCLSSSLVVARRWLRFMLDGSGCRAVDSICYLLFACLYAIHSVVFSFASFFLRLFWSHGNILKLMRGIALSTEAVHNNGKVLSIRIYVCVSCRLQQPAIVAERAAVAVVAALRLMMRKWNGSNNIPMHARSKTSEGKTRRKKRNHKRNKSYARERSDAGELISVMVTVKAAASVAAVDKLARTSITMHMCDALSNVWIRCSIFHAITLHYRWRRRQPYPGCRTIISGTKKYIFIYSTI